ncbi:hypothetical protein PGT21_034451 [Puccinia graminis f. sp. tritici]|uniref:Uncharacterized protein n=1 Tax=Puccinia graminis f. sp. tritici TaxID=56615 RepID=A0A5B0MX40_PUCGR|nr:hypothetical protein PGT21_034451 [Puccinia graminis f. sp. tritici]KAA1092015.1 hypothetical protein PGTUg99_014039 [Puccinia graminis f. sp. tritici]
MDPYTQDAYSRIRLFLTDLNTVLGSTLYATPYEPARQLNQVRFPQNFALRGPHQQLSPKRSTRRSRAWKMNHQRNDRDQLEKAAHPLPPMHSVTQCKLGGNAKAYTFRFPPNRRRANFYNHQQLNRPLDISQSAFQLQPTPFHCSGNPDSLANECPNICDSLIDTNPTDHDVLVDDNPSNHNDLIKENSSDFDDLDDKGSDLSNEYPGSQADYVDDLPEQETASVTLSDGHDPEVLPVAKPENKAQLTEPTFSMDNYSARDVDRWARTLSADQFEQLRILGPASRIESFRQYAITNLDQPTQTLTQKTSSTPQLNQEPLCHIPSEVADNQNQYVDSTSDDANNPFLHSHHVNHQPDQSTHSSYYDHSNYNTTDLDENPYYTVVYDDSVFDDDGYDGGFDNGGFDDGGFDDGGFDSGGFDDGGFDDGGFDDGGFDDGGFDDGGFDDAYY